MCRWKSSPNFMAKVLGSADRGNPPNERGNSTKRASIAGSSADFLAVKQVRYGAVWGARQADRLECTSSFPTLSVGGGVKPTVMLAGLPAGAGYMLPSVIRWLLCDCLPHVCLSPLLVSRPILTPALHGDFGSALFLRGSLIVLCGLAQNGVPGHPTK